MRNNRKVYKRSNYKNKKLKQNIDKTKNQQKFDLKRKNLKFIKRSKEAEEAQRKQKLIEDKYKNDNLKFYENGESDDDDVIQEENPYNELVSCFQIESNDKNDVIDSSSEDEDEDENDSNQENDDDDENFTDKSSMEDDDNEIEEEDENEIEMTENKQVSIETDEEQNDHDLEDNENTANEIIIEEELDEEIEKIENSKNIFSDDMFSKHFEYELSDEHIDNLLSKPMKTKIQRLNWPTIGNLLIEISLKSNKTQIMDENSLKIENKKKTILDDDKMYSDEGKLPTLIDYKHFKWGNYYIKSQIGSNILKANSANLKINNSTQILTELQTEIFSILNNYQDLFYPHRNLENGDEIRVIYCLHALNHMLKTRTKILHHNAKLSAVTNKKQSAIIPDTYRDQGLVRPKILILVPFRESAFKVMNTLISLFFGENSEKMKTSGGVINYKRFEEEYTGDTIRFPKRNPKPEDYEKLFAGNTDDTFRIGISLTKKCIKLYTEFYSSDILLASPLGLRMIIGASGDTERDYDFLSSIEILILDQAELFFAQNWDHLLHVLDHFHLQPQSVRNTDFSRVRSWCLNGLSKFYRQTLLFTSHELSEFRSLFNSKCFNYGGKIRIVNPIQIGTIKKVIVQTPQIFHKINVTSIESSFDQRFKYFINEILPQYKSSSMAHCMIYVPSYFDYVRIRNYFKTETINFVQICEYSKESKIARARDMFYHSGSHFLLYSERGHFFRRTRIKGIRNLIMYQPPYWPNFYSEIINLMQDGNQNSNDGLDTSMSITILYTKYDILQISSIVGTEKASKMLKSDRITHIFMNES